MADSAKILAVLARVENGESERSACRAEDINVSTYRQACLKEVTATHYARALEGLAASQVQQLEQTITDMRENGLDPQIGRIEVDARKWLASKMLPKRYGEKMDLSTGGGQALSALINVVVPSNDKPNDDRFQANDKTV